MKRVDRLIAEEIEVLGFAAAYSQGQGGSAVEHERLGQFAQFWPQAPLCGREDVELRLQQCH